jgi:peptide/nickel transport system permease protein
MKPGTAEWLSLTWIAVVAAASILAPVIATASPGQPTGDALLSPAASPPMGTDALGRDVWARLVWGGRLSLGISLAAASLTIILGTAAALTAAAYSGWSERLVIWIANSMLAVPGLLFALLIAAAIGPGLPAVVLAVGLGGAPGFARLARTAFLQVREEQYVQAARALGAGRARISIQHLLPNASPTLLSLATTHYAWAFLGTTTLAFLGLAGDPSAPEWGVMLNAGRASLPYAPWLALIPGLAISLTILSVQTLGDYLSRHSRRSGSPR